MGSYCMVIGMWEVTGKIEKHEHKGALENCTQKVRSKFRAVLLWDDIAKRSATVSFIILHYYSDLKMTL